MNTTTIPALSERQILGVLLDATEALTSDAIAALEREAASVAASLAKTRALEARLQDARGEYRAFLLEARDEAWGEALATPAHVVALMGHRTSVHVLGLA